MVGDSRPPRNTRNGRGFCREDQLADRNPTSHRKSCRAGQPVSSGLFGRSLRSANRRDGISRGHCSRDKRRENSCLQADPDDLVNCGRKALKQIFGETRPKISDQRRFPRPRGVTCFASTPSFCRDGVDMRFATEVYSRLPLPPPFRISWSSQ